MGQSLNCKEVSKVRKFGDSFKYSIGGLFTKCCLSDIHQWPGHPSVIVSLSFFQAKLNCNCQSVSPSCYFNCKSSLIKMPQSVSLCSQQYNTVKYMFIYIAIPQQKQPCCLQPQEQTHKTGGVYFCHTSVSVAEEVRQCLTQLVTM